MTQLEKLTEQLDTERAERAFRERVQIAMAGKLEAEARAKQAATLKQLKTTLDHEEALGDTVQPLPVY